jgi:tetratricopeptide (TPR) repeat protein
MVIGKRVRWLKAFRVTGRSDRVGMAVAGTLSFLLFALTLSGATGAAQGSWLAARSLGLLGRTIATHPLALSIYRATVSHTPGWQMAAGNAVSALLMATACAALFRFCRRLSLHEPEDPEMMTGGDGGGEGGGAQGRAGRMESGAPLLEQMAATVAAAAAVAAFAVSPAVRLAATQQSTQAVVCLLLAAAADQLMMFSLTGLGWHCYVAAALVGAGCVESPVVAVAAPVYAAAALWVAARGEGLTNELFSKALLSFGLGVAAEVALFALESGWAQEGGPAAFGHLCAAAVRSYWAETRGLFPQRYWVYAALPAAALLPVPWVAVRKFHDTVSRRRGLLAVWCALVLANSVAAVACMLGLRLTPWGVFKFSGVLPAEAALGVALAVGLSAAFWGLAGFGLRWPDEEDDGERGFEMKPCPFWARYPGRALLLVSVAAAAAALGRQWNEGDIRNAEFLDRTADCLLAHAGGARVLICDDLMFLHTSVRNSLTGNRLRVLPGGPPPSLASNDLLPPFLLGSADGGWRASAREAWNDWLRRSPEAHRELLDQRSQDLWQETGFIAAPAGLAYAGFTGQPAAAELRRQGDECWEYFREKIRRRAIEWPFLKSRYGAVCDYIGRMADDLGVTLALLGDPAGADRAFQSALEVHRYNICAALNSFALRTLDPSLGPPLPLYDRINACIPLWGDAPSSYAMESTFYRNGKLIEQRPDILLPAVFELVGPLQNQTAGQRRVLQLWMKVAGGRPRVSHEKSAADYTRPYAEMAGKCGLILSLETVGQTGLAEKLLDILTGADRRNLLAWSMLADLLMAKGDFERVAVSVLPAMRAADDMFTPGESSPLTQRVEGQYLLRRPDCDPAGARKSLEGALAAMPEASDIASDILAADMILGGKARTEADILHVLELQPGHALANGLLGSLRMSEGRLDEAERLLKKSLSAADSGLVENDLAELYHRRGDMKKAEEHIRHAICIDPLRPLVWDTLGNLLMEQGRLQEARRVLACGQSLDPADTRIARSVERLKAVAPGNR